MVSEALVDSVLRIANCIYKQRGYAITVKKCDVAVTLEALALLHDEANKNREKENNEELVIE